MLGRGLATGERWRLAFQLEDLVLAALNPPGIKCVFLCVGLIDRLVDGSIRFGFRSNRFLVWPNHYQPIRRSEFIGSSRAFGTAAESEMGGPAAAVAVGTVP